MIACGIYLWALKHEISSFSVYDYVVHTILAVTLLGCVSFGTAFFTERLIQSDIWSFFAISFISTTLIIILSFYFVLDSNSRSFIVLKVNSYLHYGHK